MKEINLLKIICLGMGIAIIISAIFFGTLGLISGLNLESDSIAFSVMVLAGLLLISLLLFGAPVFMGKKYGITIGIQTSVAIILSLVIILFILGLAVGPISDFLFF